jgi:hypothetical protein
MTPERLAFLVKHGFRRRRGASFTDRDKDAENRLAGLGGAAQ